MKVDVIAQAFDRRTGEPMAHAHSEIIDTEENELFRDCKNLMDIKRRYESFWNDLNPESDGVVFVQSINLNPAL